ncbi:cupin domain-containing protein [Psychrobacter sp. LV10R520-6]|uniref:cupin domain-containing protein n=1 Tax=Psychrobacter sp. LV10R520-6 TaxID=1415574 RepID=UPI0024CD28CB|nr:cupin domain-containing protein [Psychrobacter sp. LV10R520-6]SNT69997.1 anti-ECFsigma factor, ChrR [Psychrobacter sp. LV10R520-6]
MLINADFSLAAARAPEDYQWVNSPQNGVERVMLDRVGEEKARATSIVRYAPDSYFPPHLHPGGEEILVLSGTFSADDKDYPAGWYLRNPPKSGHKPYSREGAVIFVKLWQMSEDEDQQVAIDTQNKANWQPQGERQVCPLFSNDNEQVSLQRLNADKALFTTEIIGGAELLVTEGELIDAGQIYKRGSWIRLPVGAFPKLNAGAKGVTFYLKTGHLAQIESLDSKNF